MAGDPEIIARIRRGIAARGLTQTALARLLGISKQSVGQMLEGRNPGMKHWPAIADLLGCSVEWIVNGTGGAPSWAIPSVQSTEQQVNEARTIIRALTQQLEALQTENDQLAERIAALEGERRPRSPRATGR